MSVTVNRTAQRYSGGSTARSPRMVLLHTTEGVGWPSYNGGAYAPHATIKPIPGKGIEVREHISFNQSAKALANKAGGVETNRAGVLQFELMGTSDENFHDKYGWYYWPRADDAVMKALADYLKPIMTKYGIPVRCSVTFKDYNRGRVPSSYGRSNGVRMSYSAWNSYKGICGHQHCPENDHGDPGSFRINTLLKYLGGASSAPQPSSGGSSTTYYQPKGVSMSVKEIQKAVDVKADGYYGDDTSLAVREYQKQIGIRGKAVDGLWGPATEKAYIAAGKPRPEKPAAKLGPATYKALQRKVGAKPVDGKFGPVTKKALQSYLGVRADGVVGPRTVRALQRKVGASVDGVWGPATTKALQTWLNENG